MTTMTPSPLAAPVGFIGLGSMGEPMALNLLKAGQPLIVWNRTASKCAALAEAGAVVAPEAAAVFRDCRIVILMLINGAAIDAVLSRGTAAFAGNVQDCLIVNTGTAEPGYSQALAAEIQAAGGRYVEAPVSGSRKPAEAGELVAMLAGAPEDLAVVQSLLTPLCREVVTCGAVPSALYMKLAVNLFLISMITSLAESVHFAQRHGLDLEKFNRILDVGPMASAVSRVKAAKLIERDFDKQASVADVLEISRLITGAARAAGIASPMIDVCYALYGETLELGLDTSDMVAVIQALEHRTADCGR